MSARWILVSLGLGALSMSSCSYDWEVSDSAHRDASETSSFDAGDDDASLFEEAGPILDSGPESDDGELGLGDAEPAEAEAEAEAEVEAGAPCYLDQDGDGVGAGAPVDCATLGVDAGDGALTVSLDNSDCDDSNAQRSPRLTDVCGDNVDNDCDGMVDEESNNACGGACSAQLSHQPGDSCTNGLKGACARSGQYECRGNTGTVCNAPTISPSGEVCGDSIDNDCDGATDEADAVDAQLWFPDCDGDGFAVSTVSSSRNCVKPPTTTSCVGWTKVVPNPGSTQDCDDTSWYYRPSANVSFDVPPEGKTSNDLNCNGVDELWDAIMKPSIAGLLAAMNCGVTSGCLTCAYDENGQPRIGAQWWDNAAGVPMTSAPRCSKSTSDSFWYRGTISVWGTTYCPNNNYVAPERGAVQYCR